MTSLASVTMPIHHAPQGGYIVYTALMAAGTLGLLAWWALSAERRRGPWLPLLLAGGALSVVCEPLFDNLVLFWYPPHQPLPAFHAFGRSVPLCVIIGYAWFDGGLLYLAARLLERGGGARAMWRLAGIVFLIDFVAIGLTMWIHVAGFYGHQVITIGGYPLWWGAVDVSNVVFGGFVVFHLLGRLRGVRRLYLLLVPTWVTGATAVAVAGPAALALNSGWSTAGTVLASLATIVLGVAVVDLVTHLIGRGAGRPEVTAPAPGAWAQADARSELAGAREQPVATALRA
jgi:hypothetical protein